MCRGGGKTRETIHGYTKGGHGEDWCEMEADCCGCGESQR